MFELTIAESTDNAMEATAFFDEDIESASQVSVSPGIRDSLCCLLGLFGTNLEEILLDIYSPCKIHTLLNKDIPGLFHPSSHV